MQADFIDIDAAHSYAHKPSKTATSTLLGNILIFFHLIKKIFYRFAKTFFFWLAMLYLKICVKLIIPPKNADILQTKISLRSKKVSELVNK